jgi:hypothetical protein
MNKSFSTKPFKFSIEFQALTDGRNFATGTADSGEPLRPTMNTWSLMLDWTPVGKVQKINE